MQRSLRLNGDSEALWAEYLRLELLYLSKVKERRRVLGLADDAAAEPPTAAVDLPKLDEEHGAEDSEALAQVHARGPAGRGRRGGAMAHVMETMTIRLRNVADPWFEQYDRKSLMGPFMHLPPWKGARRLFRLHVLTPSTGDVSCAGLAKVRAESARVGDSTASNAFLAGAVPVAIVKAAMSGMLVVHRVSAWRFDGANAPNCGSAAS